MIVGIGVDLVDIPRFERTIERTPKLLDRLFTGAERGLPLRSLAARYAAKEALIKALGGSDGVHWDEIEIAREGESVPPRFALSGSTADVVAARGITSLHLSLSHDAGLAIAYVTAEGATAGVLGGDAVDAVGAAYAPAGDGDALLDVPEAEDPEEPR
ncbi:holo-ACP synthase [Microbacterium marinilacus]|uniref:Holo-[acyl-carrier-protein] synthase n=1 Tax=Microbacterium marinilacus TaxID=415209 RepID=A0ABP7BDT9_9MICO|nr:holo-ACP synthase [Microbacterium marinilacus]